MKIFTKERENLLKYLQDKKFLLYLFLAIFFIASQAQGQEPPAGQDAGAQAERFKSAAEEEKARFEEKKLAPAEIEIKEEEEEKPALEAISFTLKEVIITGATVFKPQDFIPLYQPYIDKEVTFNDLDTIAQEIKNKYRLAGYLTTTVYIPEQEIKDGRVEIRVAEGKMGRLSIEGSRWFKPSLIEKYFHTRKNEILNIKAMQKDILRLNQNPDLQIKAVISAGEEPQSSDITLNVKEVFPWHAGVAFDNKGTRLTGKLRSSAYLRSTNATGRQDSLFLNALYSTLTLGESVSYAVPLNTYGVKFGLDATNFRSRIGKEFKSSKITGKTQIYTPHINWELSLSELFLANANIGMDIKSIKKRTEETVTSNDQMRIPFFGFNFVFMDPYGSTSFSPQFNFGTRDFLGASGPNHPTASRANTGGFFFKYEQALTRIQRMPFKSYLVVESGLQLASHTLPSSEQLQLGGESSVRGYPEGDYLADVGGNLRADWNFPLDRAFSSSILSNLLGAKEPLRIEVEPLIFTDLGGGKLKKVLAEERKSKFLMGIGGGCKLSIKGKVFIKLEWAKRIGGGHPASGSGPSTFHIVFQSEL